MRKWDDPWWTKKPSRFEWWLNDKLDTPLNFLVLIARSSRLGPIIYGNGSALLWEWIGVALVTAVVLVAAATFGVLFIFLWIIAKIYESGRR
jgi:hypothetical protein